MTAPLGDATLAPREAVERTLRQSARMQTDRATVFDTFLVGISTAARDGVSLASLQASITQLMRLWDESGGRKKTPRRGRAAAGPISQDFWRRQPSGMHNSSRSAISPGPVGSHPNFLRVCALEAGMSYPAKRASQPKKC